MALQSKLSLFLYTLPATGNPIVVNYSDLIEKLSFTTVAPGGYGQLTADLRIPDTDQPHPELALFSGVALMSASGPVWIGETVTPVYASNTDEIYTISALGIGNCLRDDPRIGISYANQTVVQVITAEMNARSHYWILSTDLSLVLPGNPGSTYSTTYDGRYVEEIIADQALLDGDDHWGVWAHPTQVNVAGLPLGQIQLHPRDLATVAYRAIYARAEVTDHQITPSADRAYNVVEIGYYDATQTPPVGSVKYTDPRLNADGSQGSAPFRRRKYYRDLSGLSTVNKAQAQSIANSFGAVFQNITNTNSFKIIRCEDAQGGELDLWNVRADHNIEINDTVYRINQQNSASQLPLVGKSGTNLFYIVQTTYTEDSSGSTTLDLQTDNWLDRTEVRIARLQLWADLLQRANNKTSGVVQAAGAPETGGCGAILNAATAAQTMQVWVPFRTVMSAVPSSITLTVGSSANITGSASATGITVYGFKLQWTATAGGATDWFGTYQTVGN